MHKIDPENTPGFLVGRVAHQLRIHIRKFLTEAGIKLTAEEVSILHFKEHIAPTKDGICRNLSESKISSVF